MRTPNLSSRGVAAGLFLAALLPRLLFWAEWNRAGLLALPVVDALTFHRDAVRLLAGAWPGPDPFWQAPLYTVFLAGIHAVTGPSGAAVRLVQALLGAGSCLLVVRIGRRWLSPRAALAAFAVCALSGPLLYFEGQLLRETLATFLLLLWLDVQIAAFRRSRGRIPLWTLSGLLLGLAALTRENALILAPLPPLFALSGFLRGRQTGGRRRGRPAPAESAAFAAALVLIILPATVSNLRREPALVPISTSGGINFYLGNNAASERTLALRPGPQWDALAARPRREAGILTASGAARYFYGEAFRWIRSDPRGFLANLLRKGVAFLSAHEIRRNQDIYEARAGSRLLALLLWRAGPFGFPFGLVAPWALLGLALGLRRPPGPGFRFAAAVLLLYSFGVVLHFPAARLRAPLLPLFALFAASALPLLADRARNLRALAMPAAALAAAVVLVDGGWVRARPDPAGQEILRASALTEAGRREEARSCLERAVRIDPGRSEAWTALSALEGMADRLEPSLRAALTAVAADSTNAMAWTCLGTGLLAAGEPVRAEKTLRRALSLEPDLADARLNLASLLDRSGRRAEGRALLEAGARLDPLNPRLWTALGLRRAEDGDLDGAGEALERAVARGPADPSAWAALGRIRDRQGRRAEARTANGRARRLGR